MSLYEIISMRQSIDKRSKGSKAREVSDEEWAEAEELLQSVTVNDPSVRL
jgi:hypothetical protein